VTVAVEGICAQECAADEVHSPQGEIADRAHSQMLLAGNAECSLSHAIAAQISVKYSGCRGSLQEFFEPRDDRIVATATGGHSRRLALGHAH